MTTTIVVIAPYCWGSGPTLRSAVAKARVNYPSFCDGPMPYRAFNVEGAFTVDGMGTLTADKITLIKEKTK